MTTSGGTPNRPMASDPEKGDGPESVAQGPGHPSDSSSIGAGADLLAGEDENVALVRKMHLLNNAIDQIGWTNFHWKLFCLSGFGYAVDSMVALLQSVIAAQAYLEVARNGGGYETGLSIASYAGLLVGALFWGITADVIGRRTAFNSTLFIAAAATIVAGAAPSWESLGFFVALIGFGAGGNLVLDPTVFLEYVPSSQQWSITTMACWWGVGQAFTGFIAWGFLPQSRWNCSVPEECTWHNNKAWRLVFFTAGAIVFVMSMSRVLVVRLKETPKYLLGQGRDAEVVDNLQAIAKRYDRPCDLTLEQLASHGDITPAKRRRGTPPVRLALSTLMVWFSWTLIGLAYPLFYVFLPSIISNRIPVEESSYITWRNYTLTNVSGIVGPIIAGFLSNINFIGRKYTMVIGALLTMVFFFGYTAVTTTTQNVAFSCVLACCINIYYGTLYAYTAEIFPSAHRATGSGIAVALNRIMGMISAVIAAEGGTDTPVPLYVCAALFLVLALVSAAFPFEPQGRRSS
ncbi:hexose transporter [Sodiomyces alkalinus F11]|uniref:Hexose transporter n=1 Tax=Sodiomyces alkalinus (strain CBS 110278 / VKM F-3762 / F11) TaxID=1314773 RepID=A0A3N2QAX3_SODAK|nr:hexose transporter [Sodiomyces alkalinus F11]ROT43798.1 hexose transporter [Sodiomyces alkalinus F11]